MEELGLDKCFTTDRELGCLGSSGICSNLVAILCVSYMCFEFLVKLIKICDEVSCTSRHEVMLGINGNVQVIALVGEERCDSGCGTGHIVVGKLG